MATDISFQKFPKDGTMELAVEKLVDGIINNKFNETEIEFLSKEFRYNFPQKEKYGVPTKLSLDNYSKETIKSGIKEGLNKNPDLFLDMQYTGRLAPCPSTFFESDIDMGKYAEDTFKDISSGDFVPSEFGISFDDVQFFYHKLLGNKLYNSDKYKSLRDADEDFDLATQEYFKIANTEEETIKEQLYDNFESKFTENIRNDISLYQDLSRNNLEAAEESFKSEGFLKEKEAYLILASDINWKHDSGCKVVNISDFDDMIKAISPDCDCNIEIKGKLDAPYFEARVSSHDVPMGSYMYLIPESQFDKVEGYNKETDTYGQGYSFLQDAIENNSMVREFFHHRKMIREMEREGKNNPIVKKMLEIYQNEIYFAFYLNNRTCGDTVELFDNRDINDDAWYGVGEFLAKNIVQGTEISKKDFNTCKELLTKFNPTISDSEEIISKFKEVCQERIEFNKRFGEKNNNPQR